MSEQVDELQETVNWLGELLRRNFPECWTNGVTTPNQCANELLASWKREIGDIPKETCPDIDKVIKKINSAMELCCDARKVDSCENCEECNNRCEAQSAADSADDAYRELDDLEDELEALRKDNEKLRELGVFWYEKCKEILESK